MKSEARDIGQGELSHAVAHAYGLDVKSIEFLPRGEDAYAYVVGDSEGGRHFVRAQALDRAPAQESIYAAVHALRHRCGLSAAVAPYQTCSRGFTFCHGRYMVTVFPFIAGRTLYAQRASAADLAQAAAIVAALHSIDAEQDLFLTEKECFDNPFKGPIVAALKTAENLPRPGDALGKQLQGLLAAENDDLLNTLKRMDDLGDKARTAATDWVLTHGDPNLDNLLKDDRGRLFLTDWGELAVGPPERDLFMFTGADFPAFLDAYAQARGNVQLHTDILAFFFYRWCLQEIADYTMRILSEEFDAAEKEHAWEELKPYLPIRHDDIARGVSAARTAIEQASSGQRRAERVGASKTTVF